jgi:hypothetical protein
MLEVAYWIGDVPGQDDPNPRFNMYRDTRRGNNQPDRWVVFHFHFDETEQVFWDIDGHSYAGFVRSLTLGPSQPAWSNQI